MSAGPAEVEAELLAARRIGESACAQLQALHEKTPAARGAAGRPLLIEAKQSVRGPFSAVLAMFWSPRTLSR